MTKHGWNTGPTQPDSRPLIEPSLESSQIPYRTALYTVWLHRWAVLLVVAACVVGALLYLSKVTPIYTSSAQVFVEKSGPQIIAASEGFMTKSKNYLYTQCKLLKSTPILSGAADALVSTMLRTFGETNDRVGFLKRSLVVNVGDKDDIISVSLESPYPQEASEIVNAVVESYIAYHARQQRNTAAEVLKILQREKARRDAELQDQFQALMDFKLENDVLSCGADNANVVIQRLARLSEALTQAELEMADAQAQYDLAKALPDEPAKVQYMAKIQHAFGDRSRLSDQADASSAEATKLQLELMALRQQCTPDHPKVRAVESELKKLTQQFLAAIEQRYVACKGRVAKIEKLVHAQRKLAQELNAKATEYTILDTKVKRTEQLCDILDNRIKEIGITDDTGALNISVLEHAQPAKSPTRPQRSRIMAISLVLGLALGVGLAFLRDQLDHRFRSAEEITQVLGLPVLGVVPHLKNREGGGALGRIVDLEPTSRAAEAYRTIRTALYFGAHNGRMRRLLITSAAPYDGKTITASNLAIAMAQAGQKVLVLDADFRRPSQHKTFQVGDESIGLSSVLAGTSSPDQAIRRTEVSGLDVLPCGTVPPNPSEMLNSQAFVVLLEELSQQYDHVLLDAPPVLPIADARILGARCDAAILVLRAEVSSRKPSMQTVESLLEVGTQILGVVVNDAPTSKSRYGYYSGYSNHYRYGYYGSRKQQEDKDKQREEGEAALPDAA